ncbi:MAG TPA: 6-bladed beta-propeller [Solirubrobacterales bacterium]|nr:6-bladed beta-propeller [Solirubrobacterales bacterium]
MRPGYVGCLMVVGMLSTLSALVLVALAPPMALAACKGPCGEEQLRTGLANPPAWAASRRVHFEPESLADSSYSQEELGVGLEGEGGPILYRESGHVQHNPKVNLIFWGSNFNTTEKGIEVKTMLQTLFKNLSGSAYQGILTQYFDSTGRISSTVTTTSYFDEKVKAPEKLTILKLEEEISSAVSLNKWPIETSAQYFLVTAPGSTYESLPGCAFHGVTKASANVTGGIVYSFVPYQGDPPYSTNGCVETGNPSKNPVFKTSKSASHEYAEAATDPLIDGSWTASSGQEISDICQSLPDFELPSGAYAQAQYDDHLNSCASADLEPPHAYAITEAATSVKGNEATLRGTVNAESLASNYYFEYGTSKSYGSKTAETSAGSGITNQLVSKAITGLSSATTYHYRVVEINSTGTTTGEDKTFTTTAPPPGAVTEAATGVTATEAILHGAVNPNGFATTIQFEYGLTNAYGSKAPAVAESAGSGTAEIPKGAILTGLLPSTTYHFRIKATSSQGTTFGNDLTFATASLTPTFSTNFGSSGTGNGQFDQPTGIAVNPLNGNLVVPDEGNNRVQVFNEKGEYLSQFGSFGTGNGQFNQPRAAGVDSKGNIWIIDTGNNRVEKFNEKGEYLSKFGSPGTGNGQFSTPKNLTVDSKGNVWVADSGNKRVQKFNEKGEYVLQFSAGTNPIGLDVDKAGNVWSSNENETGAIEEHNEKGEFLQSFATKGTGTGQLREPRRLAVDANGYIWVPDALNNRVQVFNEKGEFVTKFGSFGSGSEQMNYPVGVAVDPRGNIWVDDNNDRIDRWKVPSQWPATFSSSFGSSGTGSGQFNQPTGIAVNPMNGTVVVPDEGNNRVQVFNAKGEFVSAFGSFGSGNGQFNQPRGATVDSKGNIWVIDTGNNRVEKFSEKGEYLSKFGGPGTGNGQFSTPKNLAVDSKGNVWVADSGNKRVQKFNEKGEYVSQFATGTNPIGLAVDAAGNVWTGTDGTTGAIEEHNEKGELILSFASKGGGNGQVVEPKRLAVDGNGFVWVPDAGNNRVEVFTTGGEYVTQFGGFGSGPEQMEYPVGVAVDSRGNVWVDDNNNRIDRWVR